jgi:hypothetical protein
MDNHLKLGENMMEPYGTHWELLYSKKNPMLSGTWCMLKLQWSAVGQEHNPKKSVSCSHIIHPVWLHWWVLVHSEPCLWSPDSPH